MPNLHIDWFFFVQFYYSLYLKRIELFSRMLTLSATVVGSEAQRDGVVVPLNACVRSTW